MDKNRNQYIPALKYDWLTPVYDPLLKWTMGEFAFKRQLVRQAGIEKNNRVLDLGCGKATLTLLLKKIHPEAEVVGLDGDLKVLEIAKTKAVKTGLKIALDRGMAFELPYPDRSFDRVLSSLVFHHLTRDNKVRTLKEVFRVLKPGGELHVADWGKPQNTLMRVAFLLVQMLDGFNTTADSVNGLLPELFSQAGFEDIQQTDRHITLFGTLALYRARKTK
ncbi:MAG: 2-methoxy-6-polyprenyl-1,4-benzoquinol methylase, mitochondrial [Chroococcidiopsis cubana SAG 39.79]|uniref:Methyltransferase domain-containing protein n=1 Tax=Chroococcidiopsis cubana SAG 39.79 TaxID=388085 RepID=A0AB37UTR3_9CYAN|nr:class I SAM-dependent methyltransferase [Chroococcidiopsis cubana]MDZ4878066.1 2-methoxy-6-polyprenyl-1,4-benzoquinol methylase, mitochondrial [Chroococcidiopsis cubana SAG 39.79]PSB66512.1 methyltransferase type 11 [Chroococcidiopsis cubana CCALA 043]RUT14655.1 hypothetical protein DSM107010_02010 [Chroococcidiopsis cubana SAG 39.79]